MIDRWVCFEEYPSESFLLASGLKKSKNLRVWAILSVREGVEGLTEEEFELSKYVSENLDELYVYNFAREIANVMLLRGDCGNGEIDTSLMNAVKRFEIYSENLSPRHLFPHTL